MQTDSIGFSLPISEMKFKLGAKEGEDDIHRC